MKNSKNYKFTEQKKIQFLEHYSVTHSITLSAEAVGVSRETIYRELQKDEEFRSKKESIDNKVLDAVENALYKKALEGNITAIIFILCNRRPDKWKNLNETKHHFGEGIDETLEKISKMLK